MSSHLAAKKADKIVGWPMISIFSSGILCLLAFLLLNRFFPTTLTSEQIVSKPMEMLSTGAHLPIKWFLMGKTMLILAGIGLLVGSSLAILFRVATRRSYEWFLAWRYLGGEQSKTAKTLIVGFLLLLVAIGLLIASNYVGKPKLEELMLGPSPLQRIIQTAALATGIIAYVVMFFGFLLLNFSLFSSISIFGVFLGTSALIVVLSVMGGFEQDLRRKILGTTSHVVVTRPKKVFGDYREISQLISSQPEVRAVASYLESEVMITSQSNLLGVLMRGIDPATIGQVTDLPRFLRAAEGAGSLRNLLEPEKLAKIPESNFKPLVSPPLGDDEKANEAQLDDNKKKKKPTIQNDEIDDETRFQKLRREIIENDSVRSGLIAGKQPERTRPIYPGVIIGAELAKNLRLYVGDDVNIVAPLGGMSPMGPIPKSRPFRVAGIFYSGMYEFDTKFVYVTIPAAQRFLGLDDEVTGIDVRVGDLEQAMPLAERIRHLLDGKHYLVQDWQVLNRNLFSALKLEKIVMFIVLIFIVLVASFSIITNLIMMVLEKGREIAALKAMGATQRSVLHIFLFAGIYIGIIGMLVGVFTGVGMGLFLKYVGLPLDPEVYYISELPVRINPVDISIVAVAAVGLSFFATIYPSLLAARLPPAIGLHRDAG